MTRFHVGFPAASIVFAMGSVAACGFPTVSFERVSVDGSASASASTAAAQPRDADADAAASAARGAESTAASSLGGSTTGGASSIAATGATSLSTSAASSSLGGTASTTSSASATSTKSNGNDNGHGNGHGSCADADGDGYAAVSCGGTDCNDSDPRANPGVTGWVTAAPAPAPGWLLGDWNCDGSVQVEYQGTVSCATLNPASFAGDSCASIIGFADAQPACGATDDTLTQCQSTVLSSLVCAAGTVTTATQGCL